MSVLIKRYWGEEPKPKVSNESNLQYLLKKIEERKRKYAKPIQTSILDSIEKISENTKTDKKIADYEITNKEEDKFHNINFTLISHKFKKNKKLKRVLPSWLANPHIISVDLTNLKITVDDIPLMDEEIVKSLKMRGITNFFPVQSEVIPCLLRMHLQRCNMFWPRDICVSAPTGSGKTLAFVLPIIQILKKSINCALRAVVVLPTKELSVQVYKVFKNFAKRTHLKVIHLGVTTIEQENYKLVKYDEHIEGYRSKVDIVVTTPGRLVDHLYLTAGFNLEDLQFLVIDEADHIMEGNQGDWLIHFENKLPEYWQIPPEDVTLSMAMAKPFRPQRLLFSATLSQDPEKLQKMKLFEPRLFTSVVRSSKGEQCDTAACTIEIFCHSTAGESDRLEEPVKGNFVGKFATPAELMEYYTICTIATKPLALYHLIRKNKWRRVLCFADSASSVHRLATLLQYLSNGTDGGKREFNVAEMSSKLDEGVRNTILKKFSKGLVDVLITTDALARGIDIAEVKCVILYDMPKFAKNYIHRVGRTGRAGKQGTALTLITLDQEEEFSSVLKKAGKSNLNKIEIVISDLKVYEESYKSALQLLKINIEGEQKRKYNEGIKRGMSKRRKRRRKLK